MSATVESMEPGSESDHYRTLQGSDFEVEKPSATTAQLKDFMKQWDRLSAIDRVALLEGLAHHKDSGELPAHLQPAAALWQEAESSTQNDILQHTDLYPPHGATPEILEAMNASKRIIRGEPEPVSRTDLEEEFPELRKWKPETSVPEPVIAPSLQTPSPPTPPPPSEGDTYSDAHNFQKMWGKLYREESETSNQVLPTPEIQVDQVVTEFKALRDEVYIDELLSLLERIYDPAAPLVNTEHADMSEKLTAKWPRLRLSDKQEILQTAHKECKYLVDSAHNSDYAPEDIAAAKRGLEEILPHLERELQTFGNIEV